MLFALLDMFMKEMADTTAVVCNHQDTRVSMGLTFRRKTAKNLAVRRKNERILAVSRKKN